MHDPGAAAASGSEARGLTAVLGTSVVVGAAIVLNAAALHSASAENSCVPGRQPAEISEQRLFGDWFATIDMWPSKRMLSAELRPSFPMEVYEGRWGTPCLVFQQLPGGPADEATVEFTYNGPAPNFFRLRVLWADRNDGTDLNKAGDVIAQACGTDDGQHPVCGAWRKIGRSYRLTMPRDWP